ncbi:MAG TPA: MFS transporter [Candidatus Rubrimentiphilum sp.]|nr:MFS transporter [Candidatus Rubrimentiphilum sp.]
MKRSLCGECPAREGGQQEPARLWWSDLAVRNTYVLIAATVGSGMAFLDATAVNVILPIVQRDLHADVRLVQWVVEGYALFLSALILTGGALGDVYGRRKIFIIGILLFGIASSACAVSQTMTQLVIARCIQGIGAALLVPQSLALITTHFNDRERPKAIGTWAAFSAITGAIGPVLGGVLAQAISWRLVFVVNVPLALAVLFISLRYVDESRDEDAGTHIDFGGATLATIGLGGLVYALIALQAGTHDVLMLAAGGASVGVLGLFVWYESRVKKPMLPLKFFASADFSSANVYTFLLYAGLGGSLFFVPFDLINVQQYTPTESGAALLPVTLLIFSLSRFSGTLISRIGARPMLVAGALFAAGGFALFALAGEGRSYWLTFFPASIVLGIGAALFVTPLTATVMSSLPQQHAGVASGVNNAVARTAGLVAVAALGLILSMVFYRTYDGQIARAHLGSQTRALLDRERLRLVTGYVPPSIQRADKARVRTIEDTSFVDAFAWVMAVSAGLSVAAAGIAKFSFSHKIEANAA